MIILHKKMGERTIMKNQRDVTCIGQACIDVTIQWDLGEVRLEEKERARAAGNSISIGGDGANVAKALAQLEYDAELVCAIGADLQGDLIRETLSRSGVGTGYIVVAKDHPTQTVCIFAPPGGERSFIFDRRGYPDFEIIPEMIQNSKIVSLNSLLYPPLLEPDKVYGVARMAAEAGAIVCADIYTRWDVKSLIPFKDALPYIDYFFMNEDEALFYTGLYNDGGTDNIRRAADRLQRMGARSLIIKLGSKGSFIRHQESEFSVPAIEVERICDTTGAGDSYMAGFIAGLIDNRSIAQCMHMGNAMAAISIQQYGSITGIHDKTQLLKYI